MAGKSNYPTGTDVQALIESARLTVGSFLAPFLDTAAKAGVIAFEQGTNRAMLAPADDETRRFNPPTYGQTLHLRSDLVSLSSVTYQIANSDPQTLVAETDYWLEPFDAVGRGWPYDRITFLRTWMGPTVGGQLGALYLTGRWGYGATLPEDVWLAMAQAAALSLVPQLSYGLTRGVVKWSADDGTSESYNANPLAALKDMWQMQVGETVSRYKRRDVI